MPPPPLISVIVPTYNRKNLLRETISSIQAQTFSDFELIVVDNMSSDGTEEFMRSLDDARLSYIRHDNHDTIAVNRNVGLRQARGKYVAFCDDDDLWMPDKLQKQLELFADEGISLVASDCIPIGIPKFIRKNLSIPINKLYRDYSHEEILLTLNPIVSSSVIARRDFVTKAGGFDEHPDFRFIEDWDCWLNLSLYGKVRIVNEPLVQYRIRVIHPNQKSSRDTRQITLNMLKVVEKHQKLGQLEPEIVRQIRGNCFVCIGKAHLDNNDREGLKFFRRGFTESTGWYPKLKALAGLFLFYLPQPVRKGLLEFAYAVRRQFSKANVTSPQ